MSELVPLVTESSSSYESPRLNYKLKTKYRNHSDSKIVANCLAFNLFQDAARKKEMGKLIVEETF